MAGLIIGVVAHTSRHEMATQLTAKLGGLVVRHDDDGTLGCAGNHLRLLCDLAVFAKPDTWVCVLEDDAQPVENFRKQLDRALECAPGPVVSFYLGTGNPSGEAQRQIRQAVVAAQDRDAAWIIADCLIGSVGYAVRGDLLEDLIDFITLRGEELPLRISRWAQDRHIPVCYTQPSMVNHADGIPIGHTVEEFAALGRAGVPGTNRQAWSYGSRTRWNSDTVPLGHCPGWSSKETP